MKYEIIPEKNLLIETFSGRVTLDDVVTFLQEILEDPRYSPEMNGIADLREVDLDVSYDQVRELVDWLGSLETRTRRRWAFVTGRPVTHGISRIFAALGEDLQERIEYFDSLEEAIRWLEQASRQGNG